MRDDEHAQTGLDPPKRDGLVVAPELRGDLARYVAELQRPLLVPDRDGVGVVLVVGLGDEGKPATGVERWVGQRLGPLGDTGDRYDADPGILPAHRLAAGRVPEAVARLGSFEQQPEPLAGH